MREMLSRSLTGLTKASEWADMIQERIRILGLHEVSVEGISHQKFLLTFNDEEDKTQQSSMLGQIFKKNKGSIKSGSINSQDSLDQL